MSDSLSPGTDHTGSVRGRLLRLLLLPLLGVLFLSVWSDYRTAAEPANEAYDLALVDGALAIAAHIRTHGTGLSVHLPPEADTVLRTDRHDQIYYRVDGPDGAFLAGDLDLPVVQSIQEQTPFYVDTRYRDQPIRMVIYRASTPRGEATIEVAETTRKRERLTDRTIAALLLPNVILIACTLIIVYFGVSIGLEPLARLRREIEARSPSDLSPLPRSRVPPEVQPLVVALNQLLRLTREAYAAQQQFVADAAHQLRTPLTGLQAQVDLIPLEGMTDAMKDRLRWLQKSIRRLAHLATQLLALARSDRSANAVSDLRHLDLRQVVEEAASVHLDQALAKNIDIGFEAQSAPVVGSSWAMRELADNLIDNALAYTPPEGRVTVRCGATETEAFLEVEDDGPGIPESQRTRVFERFYRIPGSLGDGCGLGLAIVKDIAELHGARVQISTPSEGRGTCIRVKFRVAARASSDAASYLTD